MADYIFPFFNEAKDSSMTKINVFRREKLIKWFFYLLLVFQGFISKERLKGLEEVEI